MPYQATVEGEYVVRDGRDVDVRFFEEKFILGEAVKTDAQARSVIQSGLLTERLRKIDGFKRWRTCEIIDFKKTTEVAEHSDLDEALMEATALGCVPDNIDNYKRPDFKLKALQKAIDVCKAKKNPKDNVKDEGYID